MISPTAKLNLQAGRHAAVIVAHPDDETLWTGGVILMHPQVAWTIVTLCRKSDPDRAGRFFRVCQSYGAQGIMGDLDDAPEQIPLDLRVVQETIMQLLPSDRYDLLFTHGPWGEYTRHLRHEEVSRAVMNLRWTRSLRASQVLQFAYDDDDGENLPHHDNQADLIVDLGNEIWQQKRQIITELYGFGDDSWEARTTPHKEAFWVFGGH